MSRKHKIIDALICSLEDMIIKSPNAVFIFPLRALMWLPVLHDKTLKPAGEIKYALLRYVQQHTYALDKSKGSSFSPNSGISTPTANKYLVMIEDKRPLDYTKKTWDKLFDLTVVSPRKQNMSISQFWWRFTREHYPEMFAVLADKSDPFQSAVEVFWIDPLSKKIMVNLSAMYFLSVYMLSLKNMASELGGKDSNSFKSKEVLENLSRSISKNAFKSNDDLCKAINESNKLR